MWRSAEEVSPGGGLLLRVFRFQPALESDERESLAVSHGFRKKSSAQQIVYRLEGTAYQDTLGPSFSDVLQAHQFIARCLINAYRPGRCCLRSRLGFVIRWLRRLLAAVRSITAEGVVGNSRADGANGYGSDGTGHGFLVQFDVS
jgi:hypothetical protein